MHISIQPERPDAPEVIALISELNDVLNAAYPPESRHGFSVEKLLAQQVAFFLTRVDGMAAGCGGIKLYPDYGELKRMYVRSQFRGLGLAKRMIATLEGHALQHGIGLVRLETGIHQTEAMQLYERAGYCPIGPFGEYQPDPLSRFYEKHLDPDEPKLENAP